MRIDDIPTEERIRIARENLQPAKKADVADSPIGQVLDSIHQERIFMRSVLEKIASTSNNFESKLAQEALKTLDSGQ